MSSELGEGRISITGVPNEFLSGRYFFDENESPTLGHLHALLNVAYGKLIPENIKMATLEVANRHQDTLEREIDQWNKEVILGLGEGTITRFIAFSILCDAMALSYGSELVNPRDRKMLILKAVDLAERSIHISRN